MQVKTVSPLDKTEFKAQLRAVRFLAFYYLGNPGMHFLPLVNLEPLINLEPQTTCILNKCI